MSILKTIRLIKLCVKKNSNTLTANFTWPKLKRKHLVLRGTGTKVISNY